MRWHVEIGSARTWVEADTREQAAQILKDALAKVNIGLKSGGVYGGGWALECDGHQPSVYIYEWGTDQRWPAEG